MIVISGNYNHHIDKQSDYLSKEFIDLLSSMDFSQHVMHPTHNRGHTPDLVISHGLSTSLSSVGDLAISDHYCVFFNGNRRPQCELLGNAIWLWKWLQILLKYYPKVLQLFLPASCEFIQENFNCILKSSLNLVASLAMKKVKTKPSPRGETRKSENWKTVQDS